MSCIPKSSLNEKIVKTCFLLSEMILQHTAQSRSRSNWREKGGDQNLPKTLAGTSPTYRRFQDRNKMSCLTTYVCLICITYVYVLMYVKVTSISINALTYVHAFCICTSPCGYGFQIFLSINNTKISPLSLQIRLITFQAWRRQFFPHLLTKHIYIHIFVQTYMHMYTLHMNMHLCSICLRVA